MPTLINDSSDMDKLWMAFDTITGNFRSFDGVLEAFGLASMPMAQRYGIMFGILVFVCTVTAVVTLLVMGGTFKRIKEQADTGGNSIPTAVEARQGRALLLERLLEAREKMLKENYPTQAAALNAPTETTNLTKMLINLEPGSSAKEVSQLVEQDRKKRTAVRQKTFPEGYVDSYVLAYKMCMDKPGGVILSGMPEARFEAYARSYAGCGLHTTSSYRRSYARLYESMACKSHGMVEQFADHFTERPQDIVGRVVRLEPLEVGRHLQVLYDITCGDAFLENRKFVANEVWGFQQCGPFDSPQEMKQSSVFCRKPNEAAFAIVENLTERVIGCVVLTNDDPKNLNISIEAPLVKPTSQGTVEQLEACFLLMDKLFAIGYRRIQLSLDSGDITEKKLPGRLGFTQEGIIPKHMIVKESNRDSLIYGMLNSDWDKGARAFLYKKLHGAKWEQTDQLNNAKEAELEHQNGVLKDRKEKAAQEARDGQK